MSDDIVTRLRALANALAMGEWIALTETCATAAAEIERLRVILQGWEHSARNAERDIVALRAERDEARREICRNEADDISMELLS